MRHKAGAALFAMVVVAFPLAAEARLGSGPPPVAMSVAGRSQAGELGSFCWPSKSGPGMCADAGYAPPASFMRVASGTRLRFRIGEQTRPSEVGLGVSRFGTEGNDETKHRLTTSLRPTWVVDLPPGQYDLFLFARWGKPVGGSDASWSFGLRVVDGLPRTGGDDLPVAVALGAWLLVAGSVLRRFAAR